MIRCDKNLGTWEVILKLPTENGFFPNKGIKCDKV